MKFDNSIAYLKLDFITPNKALDLSGEPLTLEQIKELLETIKKNPTVAKLDLSHCALTNESLEELAKFLETDEHLIELNISSNSFTFEGTQKLSAALENNSTLQVLNVENNRDSDNLIKVLSKNTTLQILNLTNPKNTSHKNLVSLSFPSKHSLNQLAIDGTFHYVTDNIYTSPQNTIGGHVTKLHYITSDNSYFPTVPVFPLLTHVTIECSKIFGLSKFLKENEKLEHAEIIFNSSPNLKQIEACPQSNLKSLIIITKQTIADPSISTQLIKFCKSFPKLEKLDLTQVKFYNVDSDISSQLETLFMSKSFVHIGFPIIYPKQEKTLYWNDFYTQLNTSYKKIILHNKTLNSLSILQSPREMTDALSYPLDEINTLKKINLLISYNANTLLNKIASSHLESADIHFNTVKIIEPNFQNFTNNTSLTHINITSDSINDQSLIDRLNENLSKICDENKLLKAPLAYLWHLLIKANGLFEEEQKNGHKDNVVEELKDQIPDGKQEIKIINSGHQSSQFKKENTNQKSALEIYRDLLNIMLWNKKINRKMEHYFYSHEFTLRLSAESSLFSNYLIFTGDPNAIEKQNRLNRELKIIDILKPAVNSISNKGQAIENAILETIKFHACLGIIYAEESNLEAVIFCARLALEITNILNRLGHPIDKKSKELLYDAIKHLINQIPNNISDLSIETVYHLSLLFTSSEIWEYPHVKFAIAHFIALLSNPLLKTRVDDQRLIFLLLQDTTQPTAELLKKQAYLHFSTNTDRDTIKGISLEGFLGVEKIVTLNELRAVLKKETVEIAFSNRGGLPALLLDKEIKNLLVEKFRTANIELYESLFLCIKASTTAISLNDINEKFQCEKRALISKFEKLPEKFNTALIKKENKGKLQEKLKNIKHKCFFDKIDKDKFDSLRKTFEKLDCLRNPKDALELNLYITLRQEFIEKIGDEEEYYNNCMIFWSEQSEKHKEKNTIHTGKQEQEIVIKNIPASVNKTLQPEGKSNDHSKEMEKNFDINEFLEKNKETLKNENQTLEKTKEKKIELINEEIKRLKDPIISKLPFFKSPEKKIAALENLKTFISAATKIESIKKFTTIWKEENKKIMEEPRNLLSKNKKPNSQNFLSKRLS